jgi:hypothetical protein
MQTRGPSATIRGCQTSQNRSHPTATLPTEASPAGSSQALAIAALGDAAPHAVRLARLLVRHA